MMIAEIAGIAGKHMVILVVVVILVLVVLVLIVVVVVVILVVVVKTHAATHTKVEHCAWKAAASLF